MDLQRKPVKPTAAQLAEYAERRAAKKVTRGPDGLYFGRICIATDADPEHQATMPSSLPLFQPDHIS